jgi:hypothetical protein
MEIVDPDIVPLRATAQPERWGAEALRARMEPDGKVTRVENFLPRRRRGRSALSRPL